MSGALMKGLGPAERAALTGALLELLRGRALRLTAGESSSLPTDTAREMLDSLAFTLELACAGPEELLGGGGEAALQRGTERLLALTEESRELWQSACLSAPETESLSYRDTLRGIGGFFRRYDPWLFAHQVPCEIDYQLCLPVPEELRGVCYIREYLRRLLAENVIFRRFDRTRAEELLAAVCPDYRVLLVNLCEPLVLNACALALADRDPAELSVDALARARIRRRLEGLGEEETAREMAAAARRAFSVLKLTGFPASYGEQVFLRCRPRLRTALVHGGLEGLFPAFGPDEPSKFHQL